MFNKIKKWFNNNTENQEINKACDTDQNLDECNIINNIKKLQQELCDCDKNTQDYYDIYRKYLPEDCRNSEYSHMRYDIYPVSNYLYKISEHNEIDSYEETMRMLGRDLDEYFENEKYMEFLASSINTEKSKLGIK